MANKKKQCKQEAKPNNNQATFNGSGNLTEAELENRRLKRELKDTQDALEILSSNLYQRKIEFKQFKLYMTIIIKFMVRQR